MTELDKFESNLKEDLHSIEKTTGAPEIFRLAQARNRALIQSPRKAKFFWPALGATLASALMVAVLVTPDN